MNKLAFLGLAVALAAPGAAFARQTTAAQELSGRVAGKPVECIQDFDRDRSSETTDDGAIIMGGRSAALYLNRPDSCPFLRSDRIIIDRTPSSQLCRGDIFEVRDQNAPISYGSCTYGSFTPYTRPKKK
jgi:hypothetical protein